MTPWCVSSNPAYPHVPDASWPFAIDATQSFTLSPRGLAMTMSITNRAHHAVPAGLGWHPFFVKRPGSRSAFAAQARWEMRADPLPAQRLTSTGLQADVADLVVYTLPERGDIAIEPVSPANNAFNRAAQGLDDHRTLGPITLQPGEIFSCAMRIALEPSTPETSES